MGRVSIEQVRGTYKSRDSWWTVLLVDPVAARLVQLTAGLHWLTPTRLTWVAFLLGLAAAGAFLAAGPGWLVAGAILYYVSFTVDCVDGKIARLRRERSMRGSWLDFLLDRLRVMVCTVALFTGQYLATGGTAFLFAATGVVFLTLIGYLNGAETDKVRRRMAALAGTDPAWAAGTGALPGFAGRVRAALHRRRIRMNLVSAVELEMALFVVAPLAAAAFGGYATLAVAAVAAALLILFELALVTRFWLAAGAFDRRTGDARDVPAPRPSPVEPGSAEPPEPRATAPVRSGTAAAVSVRADTPAAATRTTGTHPSERARA